MVDVVIPYWTPPHGDHELKFALRSIAETVSPERVFLLGDCPDWVTGVEHAPGDDTTDKPLLNVMRKLRALVHSNALSEEFLLWNDDFFALKRRRWLEGSSERLSTLEARTNGTYAFAARNAIACVGPGHRHAELHCPMLVTTEVLGAVLNNHPVHPVLFRTLVAAWSGPADVMTYDFVRSDRLAKDPDDVPALMAKSWFSTVDSVSCDPVFTKAMTARFPEPCRFEKG